MRWAGFAAWAGFVGRAGFAGRNDDGGEVGAVVAPSGGGASFGAGSGDAVRLQLTVGEQWA
ncbi:hypothetical protein [Pseudarthrobacter defluvii]|uniref:hypothetical protein n=1 Tax=Pseudarthrobacter defluvii TaxID=410837 RepID=UPI002578F2BF|nr:hypothetical protein [Pseudarthrobacter defluvii]WJH24321.1 hypothetical protein JCQ34_18265 [Pseudarthrobacter defluvii]